MKNDFPDTRPAATFATRTGALETFARLAQLARGHGLRVMLEIVPGRIARENPLRAEHPEWYVERAHDDALIDPRSAAHEQGTTPVRTRAQSTGPVAMRRTLERLRIYPSPLYGKRFGI